MAAAGRVCWTPEPRPCPQAGNIMPPKCPQGLLGPAELAPKDPCDPPYAPDPRGSLSSLHVACRSSIYGSCCRDAHFLPFLPGPALSQRPGRAPRPFHTWSRPVTLGLSLAMAGWQGLHLHAPWPPNAVRVHTVPRTTEVRNGGCSHPSNGPDHEPGPVTFSSAVSL